MCALLVSMSGGAAAEPAKPAATSAEDSVTLEARARFEEGIKLAEAGDHEAARLKFNQAWALLKNPAILYNLARAEQLSGHLVEALEHYRQFAKMPPDPKVTDAQRQRVAETITELSKKVAQIAIEAPPGARVTVDGRLIDPGNTDPIPVTSGKHVVESIANGKVKSVTVDCKVGVITKATLTERPAPPPDEGSASRTLYDDVTVPPPEEEAPGFWTTGRAVGLGAFGLGLAGVGAGIAFHMSAQTAEENATAIRQTLPEPRTSACSPGPNAEANRVACAKLQTETGNQNTRGDLRTAFLIGGGVLAVGGAVLFLVSTPDEKPTTGKARVIPFASAREGGLAVVGTF
ncbi:MAG: tetratricopeptide repeat protein [Labilithrix sp.]|nr:tetratricopeptide repeat protein [Labilithrix sp.]